MQLPFRPPVPSECVCCAFLGNHTVSRRIASPLTPQEIPNAHNARLSNQKTGSIRATHVLLQRRKYRPMRPMNASMATPQVT
jgi:hypothetical protein